MITIEQATEAANEFLKRSGWNHYNIRLTEQVWNVIVEPSLFSSQSERTQIIVDGLGQIIKFGKVEDLRIENEKDKVDKTVKAMQKIHTILHEVGAHLEA